MKKIRKISIYALVLLILTASLAIYFSPYSARLDGKRTIEFKVEINAPTEFVFSYLGNSDNAKTWSVFVDHINTLNEIETPDGTVGSVRRCFVNSDESGMLWDEEILEVVENQYRKLSIFNMQDFPMTADNLQTEQLYEPLSENKCALTFSLFFKEAPGFIDELKMYYAAYQVQSIFSQNLENIKKDVEAKYQSEN